MRSVVATVFFLVITIVLSIITLPFAVLDRSGKSYLWFARIWAKSFLALYGIRVKVEGVRHIHKHEHYVFASNHASYADIPAILGGIPHPIRLVLRDSLTKVPIWGWALLASPMIIINRSSPAKSKKTLAQAVEKIHDGASVLLFPEGTRTADGMLQEFKRGTFHIAYQSGAKVLPVALVGTFDVLPRQKSLPKSNMKVVVRIGEPLVADASLSSDREKELDLMRRTEAAVAKLLYLSPPFLVFLTMHVISRKKLNEFADQYPEVRNALISWYKTMKTSNFNNFAEIREIFPTADKIGKHTVFNIGGNKVRLVAALHYNRKRIYIRAVLTHEEYDKNKWKE